MVVEVGEVRLGVVDKVVVVGGGDDVGLVSVCTVK